MIKESEIDKLRLETESDYEIFTSNLRESVRKGEKIALIHICGEGRWFLLMQSLYKPQLDPLALWKALKLHRVPLLQEITHIIKNEIQTYTIASNYSVIAKIQPENKNQPLKFLLIGTINVGASFSTIYDISTFLKRKCAFTGIASLYYIEISNKEITSYFILKSNNIKHTADFLKDLVIEQLPEVSLITFQKPEIDLIRALVALPSSFYPSGKLEGRKTYRKFTTALKKTFRDYPHPTLYTVGV